MTAMLAAGFALPVSAATQVEVTGNPVMIRADAGLKNTVVSKAHKGDKYDYVGQKKDSTGRVWYNIKYSGNKTGWITSQFAKKTEDSAANPVKDYEGTCGHSAVHLTRIPIALITVRALRRIIHTIPKEMYLPRKSFIKTVWVACSSTARQSLSGATKKNWKRAK